MRTLPAEFSDLLTARGLKVLAGRDPKLCGALLDPATRFLALRGLVDAKKAARCRDLLDQRLHEALTPMSQMIPAESIWEMTENYSEQLPKTVRVRTAMLESRRARSHQIAEETGLVAMLRSQSFGAFAAALAGRPLRRQWGIQTLCYGPGDYAGPHNDHHPEDDEARDGYLDLHLTLCNAAVDHQWLVYGRSGHLSEIESINTVGGMTAYRLPFWHYTTPLVAKRGRENEARRWVLLGTFLFARDGARASARIDPPSPAAPSRRAAP